MYKYDIHIHIYMYLTPCSMAHSTGKGARVLPAEQRNLLESGQQLSSGVAVRVEVRAGVVASVTGSPHRSIVCGGIVPQGIKLGDARS